MDRERWATVQRLFHEALQLPEVEREAFLIGACEGDPDLLAEVSSLVAEDADHVDILEEGVDRVAADVFDGSVPPLKRIGPYDVLGVLGKGGMGVVYLGERADLGHRVAIKVLRDASLSPERRRRFAAEQRTLAGLSQPNIARFYDADSLPDGTPYLVMEWVEGEPITDFCRAREWGYSERLKLFRTVCEAVSFAHRHAVIHRDLKPSNIFVTTEGVVKLLDFGIAKQLDLVMPADETRTGFRLMTPGYASPEQLHGGVMGVHTDIYQLGLVLYEVLTGRSPFRVEGRSAGQVEAEILSGEVPRPSSLAREGRSGKDEFVDWNDLDLLCQTAMHADPDRRYRSADGMARDIERLVGGLPLEARPDSIRYRGAKFLRRNRGAVATAAVVLASIGSMAGYFTWRLAEARDRAVAEAARAGRIQAFTVGLFTGGDDEAGPSDTLRALTLLERGVASARALRPDPEVQAEMYETLGVMYQQLGLLGRADSLLSTSLATRRSLSVPDRGAVGRSLVALGSLRTEQAEFEQADSLLREGLDHLRAQSPPDDPLVVSAMVALGAMLGEAGQYEEGISLLDEAVAIERLRATDVAALSGALSHLANTHYYAGNLDAADSLNREVLVLDGARLGDRHPNVGDALLNLGVIEFRRARYPEAEAFHREARDIFVGHYGVDHPKTASAETVLGQALIFQERYDEARLYLEHALRVREDAFGPDHPRVSITLSDLATIALQLDDYEAAESAYLRIVDIYRASYGEDHWFVAIAISNLAAVATEKGEYRRAEALFRDAGDRFVRALGEDDSNVGIARIKLGRTLLRQGRFAEAEVEILAGLTQLSALMEPGASWLQAARSDLAAAYEGLGRSEDAARYRAEWERVAAAASN